MSVDFALAPAFQRSLPAVRMASRAHGFTARSRLGLLVRFAGDRRVSGTPFDLPLACTIS